MRPLMLKICLAASLLALGLTSASAYDRSTYDGYSQLLPDWQVFGFDLTSVPGDIPSLMAFKASLDPRTQLAVNNRCWQDISVQPWRYSAKVRMFCWGR